MLTAGAESVLAVLARQPAQATIKLPALAKQAGISRASASRAIQQLTRQKLISADRPRQGGPTAVYTFSVRPAGRALALFLRETNDRLS